MSVREAMKQKLASLGLGHLSEELVKKEPPPPQTSPPQGAAQNAKELADAIDRKLAASQTRMMEEYRRAQVMGMQNNVWISNASTSALGAGTINPGKLYNPQADTFAVYVQESTLGRFEVRKVENGYILRFSKNEGSVWSEWIAADVTELADMFVKLLVEAKLDKAP